MQPLEKYLLVSKSGIVLILSLIWLVLFSTLTLIGLQISIMQTKMVANYQEKIQSLALAEAALAEAYTVLDGIKTSGAGGIDNSFYTFTLFNNVDCTSCIFYQVQATGLYHKAKTVLSVIYSVNIYNEIRLDSWKETL